MSNSDLRVSVVIPTFKRECKYLHRAMSSIKHQTYTNIEIVVIDDNQSDSEYREKNIEFMKEFENDPNVIYYLNSENIGGSLARNVGINLAAGNYITFLDDDDEYLPEKVEKQLKFMINNDCDMSFAELKIVNEKKILIDYREHSRLKKFDKISLLKYHIMRHLTGTPTFMFKAEKLREIGGFEDAKIGQEFYLMLKSIENDFKICYLNDCDVIAYRHHDGGISHGQNKIDGENKLYNFKKNYFVNFSMREKMFIRFRHYAVMMVAYKRNKHYVYALGSGLVMIFVSPFDFIKEISRFIINIMKKHGMER